MSCDYNELKRRRGVRREVTRSNGRMGLDGNIIKTTFPEPYCCHFPGMKDKLLLLL